VVFLMDNPQPQCFAAKPCRKFRKETSARWPLDTEDACLVTGRLQFPRGASRRVMLCRHL